VYTNGKKYSTEDGSLRLEFHETQSGTDRMGPYMGDCFQYMAGGDSTHRHGIVLIVLLYYIFHYLKEK
jgi:hypothetical protein